jgi:hypothetical protein
MEGLVKVLKDGANAFEEYWYLVALNHRAKTIALAGAMRESIWQWEASAPGAARAAALAEIARHDPKRFALPRRSDTAEQREWATKLRRTRESMESAAEEIRSKLKDAARQLRDALANTPVLSDPTDVLPTVLGMDEVLLRARREAQEAARELGV